MKHIRKYDERAQLELLYQAVNQCTDAIIITDKDGIIVYVNHAFEELTGYAEDEVMGQNINIMKSEEQDREKFNDLWETVLSGNPWKGQLINRRKDGTTYVEQLSVTPVYIDESETPYYVSVKKDVTDRVRAEKMLKKQTEAYYHLSLVDPLTELYNRRHIYERLNELLEKKNRKKEDFAVCIIDLDHFKYINDFYGHLAGDHILSEFASEIRNHVRTYDIVGRYGGEEFIVIFPDTSLNDAFVVLNRLKEFMGKEEFEYDGHYIQVRFSAGIAVSSEIKEKGDIDSILKMADKRLYQAKENGRNQIISD